MSFQIVAFMALSINASVLAVISLAFWFYMIHRFLIKLDQDCRSDLDDPHTTVTSDYEQYLVNSSTTETSDIGCPVVCTTVI